MRVSSGIDIVQVSRIKANIEAHGKSFLDKVFTFNEQKYCLDKKNKEARFAGRFAAKEAFIKAVGGSKGRFRLNEIEVLNEDSGKPFLNLSEKFLHQLRIHSDQLSLSLSHEKDYAVASVVIFREKIDEI